MIKDLNEKFAFFGVSFENCSVKNVYVNEVLTRALEEKSKCKYLLQNHIKEYGNQKLTLENLQAQETTDMKRENDRKLQDLRSQIDRSKVEQDQLKMSSLTKQEVAIVKAEEVGAVLITQVEGQKNMNQSQVQAKVVELVNRAKAGAQTLVMETKQKAEVKAIEAESKLQATRAQYAALAEEGKAEANSLDAFAAQRRHEYEMKRGRVYEQLAASQSNMVISGVTGDAILKELISRGDGEKQPKK